MYKLVIIGGSRRGEEFILSEGENILGRESSCQVVIDAPGVSKKHFKLTVKGEQLFLEDLGSSNGTFLNGKVAKRADLKAGDKVAIPNIILQVVFVREKKVIVHKQVIKSNEGELLPSSRDDKPYLESPPPADGIAAKLINLFKFKYMSFIHGLNEEYEWRSMVGTLLIVFTFLSVTLTVAPILQTSKGLLSKEISKRGAHYVDDISRLNAKALEQKNLEAVDSKFLVQEDGVNSYEVFDLDGNIFAPIEKVNQQTRDPFSIRARDRLLELHKKNGINSHAEDLLDSGEYEVGIAKLVKSYSPKTGQEEPVGIAAIRFRPSSLVLEAAQNSSAYLESIIMSVLIAILFFGTFFYLTKRPIEELRIQTEQALNGNRKEVETILMMSELSGLKAVINSMIHRIRDLTTGQSDENFNQVEPDDAYVDTMREFMQMTPGPVMILNSEKLIKGINLEAEDLLGIRESSSLDQSILDTAREKGLAATLMDLCDQSANTAGKCAKGTYELVGNDYNIHAIGLVGKDGFAKAFLMTFIKG